MWFHCHPHSHPNTTIFPFSASMASRTWTDARLDCISTTWANSARSRMKRVADLWPPVSYPHLVLHWMGGYMSNHITMSFNPFQLLPQSQRHPLIWQSVATWPSASCLIVSAPRTAPAFPETWIPRTWVHYKLTGNVILLWWCRASQT